MACEQASGSGEKPVTVTHEKSNTHTHARTRDSDSVHIWHVFNDYRPFSQGTCFLAIVRKAKVMIHVALTLALFSSSVPLRHERVTVTRHKQEQGPETEAA